MKNDLDNGPQANHEAPLLARIKQLEELLRSACAIAERKGAGTAWDRFLASAAGIGVNGVTARTYRVLPDFDLTPEEVGKDADDYRDAATPSA